MAGKNAIRVAVALVCAALSLSCDEPQFDSQSEVNGLRILGLSSSAQIVAPGQPLTLDALWVDSRPDANDKVIAAWFPGCLNPEFTSYEACVYELNNLRVEPGESWPAAFAPIAGTRLETEVDSTVLEGREDFGIQGFFFAACRGERFEYAPTRHAAVPIICRDAAGSTVHQPDFRLGIRTVTALPIKEEVPTANPVITGFQVDGAFFEAHCLGEACMGFQKPDCETHICPQVRAGDCNEDEAKGSKKCDGGRFHVLVDEQSVNIDWLQGDDEGLQTAEVFARYFVTVGRVEPDFDLLHEREPVGQSAKWDRESQSVLTAAGQVFVWAVVYDSLGAVSWAGIAVETF
jgi:hypothetical protein